MHANKRLLVVDDDADFADSLADLLGTEGVEVTVAYDGAAAVELMRRGRFDLTFIDVQMPGMNGVESLVHIRRLQPFAHVVMMTGYSVPDRLERAIAAGAAAVLFKPLDLDRVRELIDHCPAAPLVLVADDDTDFAESMRGVLESAGFAVTVAFSGEEVLASARAQSPNVLLLDLRMPGINGVETYRALERTGALPPTIIISAYLDEERATLATLDALPGERVLAKPVNADRLVELLHVVATPR